MDSKVATTISPREREVNWMSKNRQMLDSLKGNWIVVEGEELVVASPDMKIVLAEIKRRGIKVPFVLYVPLEQQTDTVSIL